MTKLVLKPANDCFFDEVSLGEVMLRLDPGQGRIHNARAFNVWEGGGEYNVARSLRRCFGLKTAIVTALVDNPIGHLLEDLMLQGGVDLSQLVWTRDDGAGRSSRNGLNFTKRGHGPRAARGCNDRGHTAVSQKSADAVDWQGLYSRGVRWLHTGGIYAALSETAASTALTAMSEAQKSGTCVSYDLNYRESLWASLGGQKAAQEVNSELVKYVTVLFGNQQHLETALGFDLGVDHSSSRQPTLDELKRAISQVLERYPQLSTIVTTLRTTHSASRNGWGAVCYHEGDFFEVPQQDIDIQDRVGGGDSFASGFIYGLMTGEDAMWSLRCGVAHGALAMSTAGDTSMARLPEVLDVMDGKGARIAR